MGNAQNIDIHISAAITANARIYMYPYISRDDCYDTDADSIFLGNPLHEDEISTVVLEKFKLEETIVEGLFLATKTYRYTTRDANNVIKFKGPAKDYDFRGSTRTLHVGWRSHSQANSALVEKNFSLLRKTYLRVYGLFWKYVVEN